MPRSKLASPVDARRREVLASLVRTAVFLASKQLIGGVAGPSRIALLWLLAAYPMLWAVGRPSASFGVRLDRGVAVQWAVAAALCAIASAARIVDPLRGVLAVDAVDAGLVGALVLGAALCTWGTAAAAIGEMTGSAAAGTVAAAVLFTMAFFTGSMVADGWIFIASLAAAAGARRAGSIAFGVLSVAFAFGGVVGAAVAGLGYVAVGVLGRGRQSR